jgi:hypothetical protein
MLLSALQPVAQVSAEVATKAGTTLVESGILGTLLVVSLLGNAALIYFAFRALNLRVKDLKELAALSEKMVTTFAQVNGTLGTLNEASKTQAAVLQSLMTTMNTLVMSALTRSPPPAPNNTLPGGHQ